VIFERGLTETKQGVALVGRCCGDKKGKTSRKKKWTKLDEPWGLARSYSRTPRRISRDPQEGQRSMAKGKKKFLSILIPM